MNILKAVAMGKRKLDMTEGPLFKNIIRYTIPIVLTGLLQLLFNAADLIVVGQFCNETSVAAVGNTGAITALVVNFFMGFSTGTGVSIAQNIGARDDKAVHRAVHTAIPIAVISGIIMMIVGISFAEGVLHLMNTPDEVLPLSSIYMKIYFSGTIFIMVYNFCASILRAAGDTKSPLVYLTIAGVINVILNYIFVVFFDMNVAGVALATTISQGVSAVLVVIKLMKRTDACKLMFGKLKIYKRPLTQIVGIGLPAGIQSALFAISNTLIQSAVNSFNSSAIMSGNAAAGNIEGFVYVIIAAFNQTAINFIGQNVGAKRYDRVKKIYVTCLELVTVSCIIAGVAVYLLGPTLLSLYVPNSAEAVGYGMERLLWICLPYFICGLMDVSTGALRGMGVSVAPMIITIVGVCGMRILWIYTIFQMYHMLQCLYLSYAVTWTLTFIVESLVFCYVYKKRIRE